MSFDLVAVLADPAASDDQIRRIAADLYKVNEHGAWPDGPVGDFAVELLHRWPPLHVVPAEDIEESPWNGELTLTRKGALMLIGRRWADQVRFTVLGLAMRYGLAVVDPLVDKVFRPSDPLRLLVTTQGHGSFPWLNRDLLDWLVSDLRTDAEWLVIEHPDGSYAQSAIRDEGLLLEVRTGGPETHIGTLIDEPAEVSRRLLCFAQHDPSWRSGRSWEAVEV